MTGESDGEAAGWMFYTFQIQVQVSNESQIFF